MPSIICFKLIRCLDQRKAPRREKIIGILISLAPSCSQLSSKIDGTDLRSFRPAGNSGDTIACINTNRNAIAVSLQRPFARELRIVDGACTENGALELRLQNRFSMTAHAADSTADLDAKLRKCPSDLRNDVVVRRSATKCPPSRSTT